MTAAPTVSDLIRRLREATGNNWNRCKEAADELERLQTELESHAWEISPAMAQAKIDQLNAANAALRSEADALRVDAERLSRELNEALLQADAYLRRLNVVADERDNFAEALIAIKSTSKCACQSGGEWCDGIDIASRVLAATGAALERINAGDDRPITVEGN